MQVFYVVLIVAAALTVGAAVSLFTKKILDTQKELAIQLNRLAGVVDVSIEKTATGFRDILRTKPPKHTLDILAVSGWTVLQPQILGPLLKGGVRVRALILDPNSENPLLDNAPWMREQTLETIKRVGQLGQSSELFEVRMYRAFQPNTFLFIDNERLYLSSFRPITSRPNFVFEIVPGDKSLYQMYRDDFEFMWQASVGLLGPS